jgi:hypothetical protein
MTGKTLGLSTGTAAIWLHFSIKIFYYNFSSIRTSKTKLSMFILIFTVFSSMIFLKQRFDLLISLGLALIDIIYFAGGTIKYPKSVYE